MSKKAESSSPAYEADERYNVRLRRPVMVSGLKLLPRDPHTIKGSFLNKIVEMEGQDAIDTAERK